MATKASRAEQSIAKSEASGPAYGVRAVERVCAILNLLQRSEEGVSLIDIAEATHLPRSSAFRYLWTLESYRYVERDSASGAYRLGTAVFRMDSHRLDTLRRHARPVMEELRDELKETINLGILDGDSVIYLEIVESPRAVRLAAHPGDRDPIHTTALGKVIAAALPESRVREILARSGMSLRTSNSIGEVDDYLAELAKVRRLGFALDNGENEIDGRCVAVAMPGTVSRAALSLSAPAPRFPLDRIEEVAQSLGSAASAIISSLDESVADTP